MTVKMEHRPLAELFTELSHETRTLIKQEMELARIEMSQKISQIVKDVAALGIGGILLYSGFLTLIAAIVLGVAVFIPLWLSALLVSILFIGIGGFCCRKDARTSCIWKWCLGKSTETFKETAKWAKSALR